MVANRGPNILAASLSQTKPWLAEGISRRTWERRRVATPCQVNLTTAEHGLATVSEGLDSKQVSKEGWARLPTPPPAGQTWTYASLAEWAWQQDASEMLAVG